VKSYRSGIGERKFLSVILSTTGKMFTRDSVLAGIKMVNTLAKWNVHAVMILNIFQGETNDPHRQKPA
jgi:hypothetical protein